MSQKSAICNYLEEEVSVGSTGIRSFSNDMHGKVSRQVLTICWGRTQGRCLSNSCQSSTGIKIYQYSFLPEASETFLLAESIIGELLCYC